MNIIDKWRQMTTCKDCCNGEPSPTERNAILCRALPTLAIPLRDNRCNSGVWLFVINPYAKEMEEGYPYEAPLDLMGWLEIMTRSEHDRIFREPELVPRDQWPEVKGD